MADNDKNVGKQTTKNVDFNYNLLSKEELIERLKKLEAVPKDVHHQSKKSAKKRPFDWNSVSKRHILLKFLYFGWEYHGYATQIDTTETVEEYMIEALKKCCLIQDRETSNYHRCGRTDAGVSAFSQVSSIDVRSKFSDPDDSNVEDELEYCKMLNRLLPKYIRCYSWCHVGSEVSARFDCTSRSYNYFFPRGNLNIDAMSCACSHLIGSHDFRNLCKMDVNNGVVQFVRTIEEAHIVAVNEDPESAFQMMKLVVKSKGFLWHQIRCIMAVLLLVGEGYEQPEIVKNLLDVDQTPCKPQYHMASPLPLSLATAGYEGLEVNWNSAVEEVRYLRGELQALWTQFSVKENMIRDALQRVTSLLPSTEEKEWSRQTVLYSGILSKTHSPLLKRPTCQSLEERISHVESKKAKKDLRPEKLESGFQGNA